MERVAIVAGTRTPFVRAGKSFAELGPLELAKHAVRGLIERHHVDASRVDALAWGVVVPERGKPNIAREIVLESGLPASIEAQTVSSYCITGLRTATVIAGPVSPSRSAAAAISRSGASRFCWMSVASAFSGDTYTTCGPDPAGVVPSSGAPSSDRAAGSCPQYRSCVQYRSWAR